MTTASVPAIVLRSGVRIENPLELALEFVSKDGSYQSYDLAAVAQDDVLTEVDIRVANAMIARMSPRVMAGIHARERKAPPGRVRRASLSPPPRRPARSRSRSSARTTRDTSRGSLRTRAASS